MPNPPVTIVGAGFSGAVIARDLAEAGQPVTVVEERMHVAGNCHTERDPGTGILVHVYGPHIFHTDDDAVWAYVNRFARFRPYRHRVRAMVGRQVYSLPVNLHTISQFFGRALSPDDARALLGAGQGRHSGPHTFETLALQTIGRDLYEAFFHGYTQKQWGRAPARLPASVLARLPVRFTHDDSYFTHRHQGMPEDGYTALVTRLLDHRNITLRLDTAYDPKAADRRGHVFWSGPLDGWFGCDLGRLGYRTLDFERITVAGDHQGCAVMNYCDADVPHTRITEHKHFTPWEDHAASILTREVPRECAPGDIPFYPIRLVREKALLGAYVRRARALRGVTFVGRLGTYRYLDMDATIREARQVARTFLACGGAMPSFVAAPLPAERRRDETGRHRRYA
jgi:UDP-galactopyranose mutase